MTLGDENRRTDKSTLAACWNWTGTSLNHVIVGPAARLAVVSSEGRD